MPVTRPLGRLKVVAPSRAQDLLSAIAASGIVIDGQRGYHLLGYLAQTGTLVLGPISGKQQAFVLLEEWVREPRRLERDEALGELAGRYFRSHGPATERDLARWSGLPLRDVRRGMALCGNRLARLELGGITYHLAPEVLDAASAPASDGAVPDVRLLPGFDEFLLGYGDRSAALAPEHAQAVVPGNNGMFLPTIVIDGEVVGTWKRTAGTREAVIRLSPFGALPDEARRGACGRGPRLRRVPGQGLPGSAEAGASRDAARSTCRSGHLVAERSPSPWRRSRSVDRCSW